MSIEERTVTNALKLRQAFVEHCAGNPFADKTPLENLVSCRLVPENAKGDILHFAEKGQK